MDKIKVYIIGSCTAEDILDSEDDDSINFFTRDRFTGSINRSFFPPGKVAQRLLEDRDLYSSISQLQPKIQRNFLRQLNLITKEKSVLTLLNNAPMNSVFIVDGAYEVSPFYYNNYESFDLYGLYNFEEFLPLWLKTEIEKNRYVFDSGIKEFAYQSIENYKKLFRLIKEKNIACIVMDNSLVRNVYDEKTNSVGQIIPLYNKAFYRVFSVSEKQDPLQVFDYNQKMIDMCYKILFDIAGGEFPIFKIPKDKVYCDLNHKFGYHPSHYHMTCRKMLYTPLKNLIIDTYNKHIEKNKFKLFLE